MFLASVFLAVGLELAYDAPPECPSADALREAVSKLVTEQRSEPYAARVSITRDGASYVAQIVSSDGSERTLSGASCAEVTEATSVVLALAISPKSAEAPATPSAPAVPASPPPADTSRSQPAATTLATPSTPVQLEAGLALSGDLGTLAKATLGGSARAGVIAGAWSADVEGTYLIPRRGTLAGNSERGGDFSFWSVAALGCGTAFEARLRLALCAGAELGRIAGQGFAPSPSPTQNVGGTWLALLGGPELSVPIAGPLRARAGLSAVVPVAGRHTFTLDGSDVHRPSPVVLRSALGVDVVF